MSTDGVWRVEQLSIEGWELVGTAFLESGRYLRGGIDAFTVGTYEVDGDQITITATSTRFGRSRPVYGMHSGVVQITVTGTVTGDEITAEATDGAYVVSYRYTRLADIP